MVFSDVFQIDPNALEEYGAFNISLFVELPLFIDPFLLFCSPKPEYQELHGKIIDYLKFLRDMSSTEHVSKGHLEAWYKFPEVQQNWFGFCVDGNHGRGLGSHFASSLNNNLGSLFNDFGTESITSGSHLEKLCLIDSGVGRDMISDFTTNMIKEFLLEYTQTFAKSHLRERDCAKFNVPKVFFNYEKKVWLPKAYYLPMFGDDFVLLTPSDILTKDDTWINKNDLISEFRMIPSAIDNVALRASVSDYFYSQLSSKPNKKDEKEAARRTIIKFPMIADYYIKLKENNSNDAVKQSKNNVKFAKTVFGDNVASFISYLETTEFYDSKTDTFHRIMYVKDVIENKDGYKIFYHKGQPINKEEYLKIMLRLAFCQSKYDVNTEANNGRGPADFLVSFGSQDKTLVEFKLARNTHLRRNLQNQTKIYQAASNAQQRYIVIVYFTEQEFNNVNKILKELGMDDDKTIVLIDARNDNKPSASVA